MPCFLIRKTDSVIHLFIITMKLILITFGLFPVSSNSTLQNNLNSLKLYNSTNCSILLDETQFILNWTKSSYALTDFNKQIIKCLNSISPQLTTCSPCTINSTRIIISTNYGILRQIDQHCKLTITSHEAFKKIMKSVNSFEEQIISLSDGNYLKASFYGLILVNCTIFTKNHCISDDSLEVRDSFDQIDCTNTATDPHHNKIPLLILQCEIKSNNVCLYCNCIQKDTTHTIQIKNIIFTSVLLLVNYKQLSLEDVKDKLQQLIKMPSVNNISFCLFSNEILKEWEENNYLQRNRKNVLIEHTKRPSETEQVRHSRPKRYSELTTNAKYSTINSQLLPPRNLQIVPLNFGSLNISWIPAQKNEQFITHYELILFGLNEKSDNLFSHCLRIQTIYNHTGHHVYLAPLFSQNRQVLINVTAPADYAIITGLPPDNFYRVLLFAVGNSMRSSPATMPSSPRVPALSPQTPPEDIKITSRGTHSVKISWNPPSNIDCTGELMNYVININSSRLIEPIIIKVSRSKRNYVVENLIPGTFYSVQVSATTRGGLGVPSKAIHFQTSGELPKLDPDELEGIEIPESKLESNIDNQNVDFFQDEIKPDDLTDSIQQASNSPFYVLPSRIHNLRATATQTSIKLKWSIALRQINMDSETHLFDNVDYEYTSLINPRHLIPVQMKNEKHEKDITGLLPPGTKHIIRWGDMHPGPSEDSVKGDQTQYTIENLRPGTIYYIRVISVTEGGDGPAAYTVVMTQDSSSATKPTSQGLLIPVNLVVRQLGSTWARVGWDMPNVPQSIKMSISGFQVKYYSVKSNTDQEEEGQENEMEITDYITEQFTTKNAEEKKHELKLINMTLTSNQIHDEHFDIILRDLEPATQYEFGVRVLHNEVIFQENDSNDNGRTVKTYFWSMVQGFETFGKSPKDAPTNIRLSKLRLTNKLHTKLQLLDFSSTQTSSDIMHNDIKHDQRNDNNNKPSAHFLVTMFIKWDPPTYPNGRILASALHLTTNMKQSTRKWIERSVNGGSTEAGLLRLKPSTLYFVKITARNQHGRSPSSNIIAFYTPNADGSGGGIIQFTKNYYHLNDIHETFDRIQPFPNENELNQLIKTNDNIDTSTTTTTTNNNSSKLIDIENLHWIILGGAIGCALVIMIIITLALLIRCRKIKLSTNLTKRVSNKSTYNTSCSEHHQHETTIHRHDCLQKNPSFNLNDICLNANILGSCSPTETIAAGSNSGSIGVRTGHSLTSDQFNQNVRMNIYPLHHSNCTHSDCNVKKINETVPLLTSSHCSCGVSIDTSAPTPSGPINWIPNVGAFNIGISGGGCFEDRHSTSVESDTDANNSVKLINNCPENGRNWQNDMNFGKLKLNKQLSADMHERNIESLNGNINPSRDMTLSYLGSSVQNSINCHAPYCQQPQLKNMGNRSPFKPPGAVINPPNLQMTCCTNNNNNPHTNFNRSRDFRSNQLNKMIGDNGCTGSGSLTDEVTASSPGSSATGRTHGYLNQISSSPTNTSLNFKKYNRVIGKYEDEEDINDDLNINRDTSFRNYGSKHNELGTHQKLSVNTSIDQQSLSPLPPRKYSNNKNQILSDSQVERCQTIGTGISSRNNALSSDYASQQSSLSNKSSGSSATNHGFSPEKHINYPNKVKLIDMNTNVHSVDASFVLDRVPTPEPQHRTGPFARLMQYNLSDQPINRLQIHNLTDDDYLSDKIEIKNKVMQSPTIMKRMTTTTTPTNTLSSNTITISTVQNVFSTKSNNGLELNKHDRTPDTPDSISEQEMMRGFSTEELNQEMANLEGLMKNLSEITQNEFTC
ncbi:unnamed protein product [Schistosoma rodhaini]|nr:unnamed protein product [Schistosoma rodhaini]